MRVSFPWSADVWAPTLQVARQAEKARLMTVRVRVSPATALDGAWSTLVDEHTMDGDHVLDGGASLARCGEDIVEVCSGGEDVLGSMSWTLNQTLWESVHEADPGATLDVVEKRPGVAARTRTRVVIFEGAERFAGDVRPPVTRSRPGALSCRRIRGRVSRPVSSADAAELSLLGDERWREGLVMFRS